MLLGLASSSSVLVVVDVLVEIGPTRRQVSQEWRLVFVIMTPSMRSSRHTIGLQIAANVLIRVDLLSPWRSLNRVSRGAAAGPGPQVIAGHLWPIRLLASNVALFILRYS